MASEAAISLVIQLKDEASKGLDTIAGKSTFLGDALKFAAGGAILSGITRLSGAVSDFLGDGIADARAANIVFAQTENVIRSTGGAAGFSAEQIADMASSLSAASGKSLFGDDDIQNAQNMLLTFTGISTKLPDATQAVLDLSQATGGDLQAAALQVGKALQAPVEGISALTRVGVSFTDQQKESIAAMVAAGDQAGAQSVIIAELNREFGGSAAAAAAADGGITQFKDILGELGESLGQQVMPLISQFTALLSNPAVMAGITSIAGALVTGLGTAVTWLTTTAIPGLMTVWNTIQPALAIVATFISANLQPILVGLGVAFTAWAVVAGVAAVSTITALSPVVLAIAAIGVAAGLLYTAWNTNFLGIRDTLTAVWGVVQPVLATLQTWLATNIPIAVQALSDLWTGTLLPAITSVWNFVQNSIFPLLGALANVWIALVKLELTALAGLWQNVLLPALTAVWGYFNDNIMPILASVASTLSTILGPAVTAVVGFFNSLYTAIGGISGAISTVIGWLDSLATKLGSLKLPDWLTPGSPTPLEWGLRGIADAAGMAVKAIDPLLQASGSGPDLATAGPGMTSEQAQQQQELATQVTEAWTQASATLGADWQTLAAIIERTEQITFGATENIVAYVNNAINRIDDLIGKILSIPAIHVATGPSQSNPGGVADPGLPGGPPVSSSVFNFYGPTDGDDVIRAGRSVGLW